MVGVPGQPRQPRPTPAPTELGEQVAAEPPQWAVEAFGRPPTDPGASATSWIRRAGTVAAHREVDGPRRQRRRARHRHRSPARSSSTPRGAPPGARSAGPRPTAPRPRCRTASCGSGSAPYEREKAWAPPYVGEELAGTRQAAERERRTAALRAAEADASDDDATRERLRTEAEQAKALAQALDARAAELQIADDARAVWLRPHRRNPRRRPARRGASSRPAASTTATTDPPPRNGSTSTPAKPPTTNTAKSPTSTSWPTSPQQRDADTIEAAARSTSSSRPNWSTTSYPGRRRTPDAAADEIPDAEIVADDNTTAQQPRTAEPTGPEADQKAAEERAARDSQAPADIREVAAGEERVAESDAPRVPSADETAEAVRRAQRALIEIQHRREAEERHAAAEAEARDEELARWHADDNATERSQAQRPGAGARRPRTAGPVLELGRYDD